MKIAKNIIMTIILFVVIVLTIPNYSKAASFPSFSDIISSGNSIISTGKNNGGDNIFGDDNIRSFVVPIANILTAIGTIVLVIAFIILGIKYITATPEQAAKIKQQLIGVVVAAVVIFGAVIIWNIMYEIMENINSNLNSSSTNTTSLIIKDIDKIL